MVEKSSENEGRKGRVGALKNQLVGTYKEEEQYWSQKARLSWLQEGDKNTIYFHAVVKGRRKRNKIGNLQREDGSWTTTDERLQMRVEWGYLRAMTEKMGFSKLWVEWTMECITSLSYSFNINGENKEHVIPSRDIRQGDPLSPYLFLLCSEGLSNMLREAARQGLLSGLKISKQGPAITHLLFADDTLVFCKAAGEETRKLRYILDQYERGSGQVINLEKSSICFSKNTKENDKVETYEPLASVRAVNQGKYLGLQMVVTRTKSRVFGFIKDSIKTRLNSWKNKFLSAAGMEVMLKAVTMAMPTYAMSCFRLLVSLFKEITRLMAKYCCGELEGRSKVHWCSWDKMIKTKLDGGFRFRNLQCFNKALLGKQIWRMIRFPNLLQDKYLRGGILKRVGLGKSIKIWKDEWIPNNPNGKPTTRVPDSGEEQKVEELISNFRWNRSVIFRRFNREDAENILKIPISLSRTGDKHFWIHSKHGEYSVKPCYQILLKEERKKEEGAKGESGSSYDDSNKQIWKTLWGLNIKHKIKLFIWRCITNTLTARETIFRRTKQGSPFCSRCGDKIETVEHIMLHCPQAQKVWKLASVQWDGIQNQTDRNELEFEGKERDGIRVVQKGSTEWMEFEEAGTGKEARSTSETDAANASQGEEGMEGRDLMELQIATQKSVEDTRWELASWPSRMDEESKLNGR
ncbi:uncharacterized protein [Coffea arabica]|uniref:Reverse transcriptase domain-containing protein n=1 Tax=Coffea arabica TaxID=13443 RepID=A0A6P6TYX8_COFAR|nr:uncharacterized protein LOC113705905 [Coffea arabica]